MVGWKGGLVVWLTDLGVSECGRRCDEKRKGELGPQAQLGLQPADPGDMWSELESRLEGNADPRGCEVPGGILVGNPGLPL